MEYKIVSLLTGIWLYDNVVPTHVEIIKQNWDYYYDEGYEEGPPELNENGEAYYVLFGAYDDIRSANHSKTCLTFEEALHLATKYGPVSWNNNNFNI